MLSAKIINPNQIELSLDTQNLHESQIIWWHRTSGDGQQGYKHFCRSFNKLNRISSAKLKTIPTKLEQFPMHRTMLERFAQTFSTKQSI